MIHRCKKCNRFLAKIRSENLMTLKGKIIEFTEEKIIIKCKCGEEKQIRECEKKSVNFKSLKKAFYGKIYYHRRLFLWKKREKMSTK